MRHDLSVRKALELVKSSAKKPKKAVKKGDDKADEAEKTEE